MAENDRLRDAYLWDPAAEPSPEVLAFEDRLAIARFEATRRPLQLAPARTVAWFRQPVFAFAACLALAIVGFSVTMWWRLSWPSGAAWDVAINRSSGALLRSQLRPDQRLQFDAASARVSIARIGTMQVEPGSALTLLESTSRRHRVLLDRGAVSVRVWAPPGRFSFSTPAGWVIDMGCVFDLSVDAGGTSRVRVKTGWVQLDNGWGESLIPAGASSVMAASARPGVPVYDDAPPLFAKHVREFERAPDDNARAALAGDIIRTARTRDVLTLLMLASTVHSGVERPLLERAAQLFPPPTQVSVEGIVAGDRAQLWRWYGTLDLPPAKSWWRNWRDALPTL